MCFVRSSFALIAWSTYFFWEPGVDHEMKFCYCNSVLYTFNKRVNNLERYNMAKIQNIIQLFWHISVYLIISLSYHVKKMPNNINTHYYQWILRFKPLHFFFKNLYISYLILHFYDIPMTDSRVTEIIHADNFIIYGKEWITVLVVAVVVVRFHIHFMRRHKSKITNFHVRQFSSFLFCDYLK